MMQNFTYNIPTEIYFGKGSIANLPSAVRKFGGSKVLLLYGGGSIRRIGLLDETIALLTNAGIAYSLLGGVEPNPRIATVREGVRICREEGCDMLLPVGGGSTLDCAKAIAAGTPYEGDAWDIVLDNAKIDSIDVLPIITILTMAATGSEMDGYAVISNPETKQKLGMGHQKLYPMASVLDPVYTYSLPKRQTAAGIADILSHIFEVYFNHIPGTVIQDRVMEALIKVLVECGPKACKEPENYDARANLMWTSSWAINGFIACGKSAPWPVHSMEHQLSAVYDVTHGEGLAVLTPVWMEKTLNERTVDLFVSYGVGVFGLDPTKEKYEIARLAIQKTSEFLFETLGMPKTLRELGITSKDAFEAMADKALEDGTEECFTPLSKSDVLAIYEASY